MHDQQIRKLLASLQYEGGLDAVALAHRLQISPRHAALLLEKVCERYPLAYERAKKENAR